MFWGLVEMTFGLVYASFSLPEWQALKMTFFAPWGYFFPPSSLVHMMLFEVVFPTPFV